MSEPQPETPEPSATATTCWWHPERSTGLRCTRCERSACPECLREASVGYQCIDCVTAGRREHKARAAAHRSSGFGYRTVAGARASGQVVVTPLLIVANLLVFAATVVQSQMVFGNLNSPLSSDGALVPMLTADGEWWRLLTSAFLHDGPFHLLLNMLALWILGRELEVLLGRLRYSALYALSLLGGSAAVYLGEAPAQGTVGASGAIAGLLGAVLVAAIRLRLDLTYILVIIGVNVVITFQISNISWLAHLGGFVVGAVVAFGLLYAPERKRVLVQAGTMALIAAALLALMVFRDAQFGEVFCDAFGCRWTGDVSAHAGG